MKLIEIVNAYEALVLIKSSNDLNFSLAWKIEDLIGSMEKHYNRYNEQREKLVKKFGLQNENGSFRIEPENRASFNKEMEELVTSNINFKAEEKISLVELIDAKIIVKKNLNLGALKPFIEQKKAIE